MQAISNVFESLKDVDPLRQISIKLLQEQYVMQLQWATAYFNVAVIDSMDLWPTVGTDRAVFLLPVRQCSLRVIHFVLACCQD